jgi:hypothetical protein
VAALVVLLVSAVGSNEAPAAGAKQKLFASPEEAVKARGGAQDRRHEGTDGDPGPEARPLITSGDTVADTQGRQRLVAAYEQAHKLEKAGDAKVILSVGNDDWPLPIPLVKAGDAWRFDTAAGQKRSSIAASGGTS